MVFLFYLGIIFHLLKIFLVQMRTERNIRNLKNNYSEIQLVIIGKGEQNILNYGFKYNPSEVYINGIRNESCNKVCYLPLDENNVTLIFEDQIKTLQYLFHGLKNIKEIDLSNFDTSKVTSMFMMCCNCSNLEKINFGEINTSSVVNMYAIFYKCSKLTSLDLHNFDTTNVTKMDFMFGNCSNLSYLDLSNFKTQNLMDMNYMFRNCYSLIYLNLNLFQINIDTNINGAFDGLSPYIKVCCKDEYIQSYLASFFIISDCDDDCFKKDKKALYYYFDILHGYNCVETCPKNYNKLIINENKCIDNCTNHNLYQYEYKNSCYEKCPEGTIENNFICYDDLSSSTNIIKELTNDIIKKYREIISDFNITVNKSDIIEKK